MGDLGWDLMVAATFQRFERGPVSESPSWFYGRCIERVDGVTPYSLSHGRYPGGWSRETMGYRNPVAGTNQAFLTHINYICPPRSWVESDENFMGFRVKFYVFLCVSGIFLDMFLLFHDVSLGFPIFSHMFMIFPYVFPYVSTCS